MFQRRKRRTVLEVCKTLRVGDIHVDLRSRRIIQKWIRRELVNSREFIQENSVGELVNSRDLLSLDPFFAVCIHWPPFDSLDCDDAVCSPETACFETKNWPFESGSQNAFVSLYDKDILHTPIGFGGSPLST